MTVSRHDLPSADAADDAIAGFVASRLAEAISGRGAATLVVSGGRTPAGMLRRLSKRALRWDLVTVTLADERFVPPDHADSNEAGVRRELLRAGAAAARLVPLWSPAETPERAAAAATERIEALPRPFDVVILGMGVDGHTASLVPGAPELSAALADDAAPACVVVTPPAAPHRRLSLNRAALLDARCLLLHVRGADKRRVLERALAEGPVEELPVRVALHQSRVPCHVFWSP
jgi:6-phosphogluconolactonase